MSNWWVAMATTVGKSAFKKAGAAIDFKDEIALFEDTQRALSEQTQEELRLDREARALREAELASATGQVAALAASANISGQLPAELQNVQAAGASFTEQSQLLALQRKLVLLRRQGRAAENRLDRARKNLIFQLAGSAFDAGMDISQQTTAAINSRNKES